jgi:hypothetical protein
MQKHCQFPNGEYQAINIRDFYSGKNNTIMKGDNMTMKLFKRVSSVPDCFLYIISLFIALFISFSVVSSMASEQKEGPRTGDRTVAGETNTTKSNIENMGKGRNINKNTWGIGIRHIYLKTNTDLTKRQLLTSDGAATTLTEIPVTSAIDNGFPTSSHIDQLYIRFGLSEFLEIFGGIGAAYNSEVKPSYGGGLRLNLFQTGGERFYRFYGAVQGEYILGESKEEYQAVSGERLGKSADFKSLNSKIEFGITHSNMNIFVGGSFLTYKEDTERNLLDNLPAGLVSAMYLDELEEEDAFGVFGGLSYYLTPSILLNIEGQYGNHNGGSVSVEYYF